MGHIRFFAPNHDQLPRDSLVSAYFAGMEGIPWLSANRWETDDDAAPVRFVLERSVEESGNLYIPWEVDGYGELMLATTSLRETEEAYNLPLELARGILNRLRSQFADWEMAGLEVAEGLARQVAEASAAFIDAVTSAPDQAQTVDAAQRAIQLGLKAGDMLCGEYARQSLDSRHQTSERLPTLLGIGLGSEMLSADGQQLCASAFNTVTIPFTWRDVEQTAGKHEWESSDQQLSWCQENGMKIIGGPLLQMDEAHLPDWLYLWEDDFQQVQNYAIQHIRTTVNRYRGRVQVWICAARMNVTGSIPLSEEQRLRLIVAAVDELRRNDPQTPVVISFDQPWAEYLSSSERDLSPVHLADSLVRADLGVAGIGIELNIGYAPGGTYPREMIEYSRQLDRWNMLGLPLLVFLSAPSGNDEDSQARRAVAALRRENTPRTQAELVDALLPMILAKPYVQAVVWRQLSDSEPHEFASGGALDGQGVAKPVLQSLTSLRQQHLT